MPVLGGQIKRRKNILRHTTVREFSGGWNAVDNDLNLSSQYAKILDNMYRGVDGAMQVRWGTTYLYDVANFTAVGGSLSDNPLTTTLSSQVVTVNFPSHSLISGHQITLAGLNTTNGIPDTELNATHVVTWVDANTFTITVTTAATSSGTGGGTTGTYSHDIQSITGNVVNLTYAQWGGVGYLMFVSDQGEITAVDGSGAGYRIWDANIAAALTGSPAGWSTGLDVVSFALFGNDLIICNGVDKPLEINMTNAVTASLGYCQYLANPSGSNTYIPTARYIIAANDFLIMGGNPNNPSLIYISGEGTKGCWADDNDVIDPDAACSASSLALVAKTVDIANWVNTGNASITGLAKFRSKLYILTERLIVIGTLGAGDSSNNHLPNFGDVISNHGCISHRSVQSIGDDLLMADHIGVPSLFRTAFTDTVRPIRRSELIAPALQEALALAAFDGVTPLTLETLEKCVWSAYNPLESQYMLFVPNKNIDDGPTEYVGYIYTANEPLKIRAWARFKGWNFQCGATSALGTVFLVNGSKVYRYGSTFLPNYADFINDPAIADPPTGDAINWAWELPWADFDKRMQIKKSKYLQIDTKGDATFDVSMFVDNFYKDVNFDLDPVLTMEFRGGESAGFGKGGGTPPYGGGRRASDERLFRWPAKFKIMKMRFSGSTTDELKVVAFTIAYSLGSIRR